MLLNTSGNVFKQQGTLKIDHVVDVHFTRNIHLHNHLQTASATFANTHGTNNNRISSQTLDNHLHEGGLKCQYHSFSAC